MNQPSITEITQIFKEGKNEILSRISLLEEENKKLKDTITDLNEKILTLTDRVKEIHDENVLLRNENKVLREILEKYIDENKKS